MIDATDWILMGGLTLFAALVQSSTGFGFALMVVPVYLLRLNSLAAVQLAIIITPLISLPVLPRVWPHADRGLLLRLGAGTLLGLPAGMAVFLHANPGVLRLLVGGVVCTLALVFLAQLVRGAATAKRNQTTGTGFLGGSVRTILVGGLSGAMTSALGMPGPALMFYLTALRLDKQTIRSTMLSLVIFSYLSGLLIQLFMAGVSAETGWLAAGLAPFALVGSLLGHWVAGRLNQRQFLILVQVLLLATGGYMLLATLME